VATISTLGLKPDYQEAVRHWLAFWEQEVIDRPCCCVLAPRAGIEPVPPPAYMAGAREPLRPVAEQALAHASTIWWGGDAIPHYAPSFGPDMMSAWLGAELQFGPSEFRTNWAVPCVDDWDAFLPFRLDPENRWWRRMLDFCAILAEVFEGKMIVGHLDLHSNVDTLLAMRSGEMLCLDIMDRPEVVDRAMASVRPLYRPVYEGLYYAARMDRTGTCGWVPAYHPVRTNTIQCDFAALIGPEQFRRYARPALEEEAEYLGHCVYHYDGPDALVHFEEVCSIPRIDCIQWVPGAGGKPFIEWMDLLKAFQARGKSVWVPCSPDTIKVFHRELDPAKVFYVCHAPTQQAGEEVLKWLIEHT